MWHGLAGGLSASFSLESSVGNDAGRLAQINDYLQIDIPGPGPVAGNGYDWVKVENIAEHADPDAEESMSITLKSDPDRRQPGKGVAHFLRKGPAPLLLLQGKGIRLSPPIMAVRNCRMIKAHRFPDKVRNTIVATGPLAETYQNRPQNHQSTLTSPDFYTHSDLHLKVFSHTS